MCLFCFQAREWRRGDHAGIFLMEQNGISISVILPQSLMLLTEAVNVSPAVGLERRRKCSEALHQSATLVSILQGNGF